MQEVLNELFYGNINPNAKQFARNSEYGRAVKIVSDCEEKLLTLLSDKALELFEKLMKANTKRTSQPTKPDRGHGEKRHKTHPKQTASITTQSARREIGGYFFVKFSPHG